MLGLALQGAALIACAQVDEGMRCLDEATATALAGEATIPISGAWACCFLVGACSRVLDYARAFEWCDRIADFAERYGSRYMLAFCRAEYGAVDLWRGCWSDAEAMLGSSIEDFSRSRPAMVGGPLAGLAELRRRQGRPREAAALLDEAGSSASAQLCRARLALDRGEARRAVELGERLLRRAPAERSLERVPVLEHLVHARVAVGALEEARAALEALREIVRRVGTEPLRASVDLAEGMLEWVQADAQALPFGDDTFDAVTSSFGAIFAPDHRAVADEMLRVCRPGGTIGMLNFTPEGLISEFFGALAPYVPPPPPGALAPALWGSEDHVRELFGDRVAALDMTRRDYVERADSPRDYRELFKSTFGPVVAAYADLADDPGALRRSTAPSWTSRHVPTAGRPAVRRSTATSTCS